MMMVSMLTNNVAKSLVTLLALVFLTLPVTAQEDATPAESAAGPSDGVLSVDRAWDYRPYRVRVWICTDGAPAINANYDRLVEGLERRARLADPSGWELLISRAPNPWSFRLPKIISRPNPNTPEGLGKFIQNNKTTDKDEIINNEIAALPQIEFDDKLMVVSLRMSGGIVFASVREYDILTQQWSALIEREIGQISQLDAVVYDMVATAFMPIARVDRVSNNDVFMRARAVNVCRRSQLDINGDWVVAINSGSPVWVRDDDKFLPIIRRTGRDGKLQELRPIDFTFLTIKNDVDGKPMINGPDIEAEIQSYHRAPLAGRTSKRAQKLALVIRPPERSTTLRLVSRDDEDYSLEGFEIFSRHIGISKTEASEDLGLTDWRGKVEIPPSVHGLRVIFIKRGSRPLKKLPIMPGLYHELTSTLPNDEVRLNAEGVINGLRSEILKLVAQREILESKMGKYLDDGQPERAQEFLEQYRALPTIDEIRTKMTDDETSLKAQTRDKREMNYVTKMFGTLRIIISDNVVASKSNELLLRIQEATK